jgi:hypothetical protein
MLSIHTTKETILHTLNFSDSGYGSSNKAVSFAAPTLSLDGNGHESLDTLVDHEDGRFRSECDDDLLSVFSDTADIQSLAPSRRGLHEVTAEKRLAALLAKNEEVRPLCEEVLKRAGKKRLVDNLRRLLKGYYLYHVRASQSCIERSSNIVSLFKELENIRIDA